MSQYPLAKLALFAGLTLSGAALPAQTEALREDFESGIVPPANWIEQRNSPSSLFRWRLNRVFTGRYPASGIHAYSAWHDYGPASTFDDNLLVSPSMDLSGLAAAWLHYYQFTAYQPWRGNHWVDASTDGGATWSHVHEDLSPGDVGVFVDVDLSAYAGLSGVQFAFRYSASDGAQWFVDQVVVNDDPATPPVPPTKWAVELPSEFRAAVGLTELFDAITGGVLPGYMTVTENNGETTTPDPDAWCNVSQRGTCQGGVSRIRPYSGVNHLEMGGNPNNTAKKNVRNALVLGIDGQGRDDFTLQFHVVNHWDEHDVFDGVWLSRDGQEWYKVVDGWDAYGPYEWQQAQGIDLTGTPVDVKKKFYLMFAQEDDYALGLTDGVQIDNVALQAEPTMFVSNLIAGRTAAIDFVDFSQYGVIYTAYSLAGGGPTSTPWGTAQLTLPYTALTPVTADEEGRAALAVTVPSGATGSPMWFQAVDITTSKLSNGVAATIN